MRTDPVVVDCARAPEPDLRTIDRLARLAVAARRRGRVMLLRDAGAPLIDLIAGCGLGGVLHLEPERHAEERKQPGGVEEERDLVDPPL